MFRDTLLAQSSGHRVEPIDTPIGPTFVRTMTAGDKDDFEINVSKDGKFRCRLVMLCCCKADGSLEFGNRDLPALDGLPADALEPIVEAAMRLNKIGPKDREELEKNSPSRAADSSTG